MGDRRKQNNVPRVIYARGVDAAKAGLCVGSCPYRHPPHQHAWLKGFLAAKQLDLFGP